MFTRYNKKLYTRSGKHTLNKPIKKRRQLEAIEQKAVIAKAQYHPILSKFLYASANGGSRHILEAINLKEMGVKAGVSDLHLPYPVHPYHGAWVEMKQRDRKKARLTPEQAEWLQLMKSVGFATAECYGWEEAWEFFIKYLGGKL